MFKKILIVLCVVFLVSCSTKKVVTTNKKSSSKNVSTKKSTNNKSTVNTTKNNRNVEVIEATSRTVVYSDVVENYVQDFKETAKNNMRTHGIPASITLAQGILESGAGKSHLANTANNHFGIKCHTGWTGDSVRHDDDAAQECFRKYKDPAESYRDHSLFLTSRSRYSGLFKLEKDDYEGWAKGLRAAGYATDPKYPEKLIGYIERYNLHKYDAEVLNKKFTPSEKSVTPVAINNIPESSLHEVQKGDTMYSISKKYNLTVENLMKKNNMSDNTLSIGQKLIIK